MIHVLVQPQIVELSQRLRCIEYPHCQILAEQRRHRTQPQIHLSAAGKLDLASSFGRRVNSGRRIDARGHPQMVLNPDQSQVLARALNDVRLVLADRLEIKTDEDAARLHGIADLEDAEDLESYLALVYNFVTWVQEGLMQALLSSAGPSD